MATAFEDFQFEELKPSYPDTADLSITQNYLAFSSNALETLGYPSHVKMMVDASKRIFAVQACAKNDKKAFQFSNLPEKQLRNKKCFQSKLQNTVKSLLGDLWSEGYYFQVDGQYFTDQRAMVFDLTKAVKRKTPVKSRAV